MLVPQSSPTGVGACIVGSVAAGLFADIASAQDRLAPAARRFDPDPARQAVYQELYGLFRSVYMGFGKGEPLDLGAVLPRLRAFRLAQA
ncbi:hypothetical protein Q4543_18400 [Salipiger sp. 1_MG-2023]|uniref:hypothetical protein n=1 Tax=Salipiger sp. 1_MG-2023 TaxID=3062665 RepID=UPI0026E1A2B3|nr:hypothetical protein [Salipiger sp. 1_MG-2023]MDO6587488.1 hypothetical protein [Salipiger sp. 1_MG-2023]